MVTNIINYRNFDFSNIDNMEDCYNLIEQVNVALKIVNIRMNILNCKFKCFNERNGLGSLIS